VATAAMVVAWQQQQTACGSSRISCSCLLFLKSEIDIYKVFIIEYCNLTC
jgi:hypothetical protein